MNPSRTATPLNPSAEGAAAATRVGRNFSFRMGSQLLSALINVAGLALLGNYLHAQGYGQYAFYYALIPLIGALGDLGVGIIVTREVARDHENGPRTFGDALLVKLAASLTIFLGVLATAWLGFDPPRALLITLVAAAALTEISQDPAVWLLRAYERQDAEALLLTLSQVLWIGGLAAGVVFKLSVTFMIAVATAAFLVRFAVGTWMAWRMVYAPRFQPDWGRIRALTLQGLPFGIAMFGVVLYGRVGVLLLQALAGSVDVAYFNVAYMLSQPLGFVSTALSMSAFPVLARYATKSPKTLKAALLKTSKYQIVVALPAMVGLFLLSERVIPLLFHGGDFSKAGTALKLMSLGLVFIFLNQMSRYLLAALDRQQVYLRAIVIGLAVNAAMCALLIPRFGYIGACVAYLGAEAAILVVCQSALAKIVSVKDLLREAARPALAAAGMGVVVVALKSAPLPIVIGLGVSSYVALLLVTKTLDAQELSILRRVYASFRLPGSARLTRASHPS